MKNQKKKRASSKLWLLKRTDNVSYDEYDSFVVRATTEKKARVIARKNNSVSSWTDDVFIECKRLSVRGKAEIILGSFNAG